MKRQAGSARFDTVLKMLLIAFISLLAFSSGVFFGRVMAENDGRLKALESDFEGEDGHSVAQHDEADHDDGDDHGAQGDPGDPGKTPGKGGSKAALNEDDIDALAEKYVSAERKPAHGEATKQETAKQDASHVPAKETTKASARKTKDAKVAAHKAHGAEGAHVPKAGAHNETPEPREHRERRNLASSNAHKPIVKSNSGHDGQEQAAEKSPAHGAHATNKPDMSAVHEAARRVASNQTPPVEAKPASKIGSRIPQSLPKSVGAPVEFEYTVQVAAYPTANEAKVHANRLVEKGLPAYPVEADVKGKRWYRVSVGSFKTQKEAAAYRSRIMAENSVADAIVRRIER